MRLTLRCSPFMNSVAMDPGGISVFVVRYVFSKLIKSGFQCIPRPLDLQDSGAGIFFPEKSFCALHFAAHKATASGVEPG